MATIKLVNNTQENIRIAIFKKPYKAPSLKVVAWHIEPLPIKGKKEITIPTHYEIYINYSLDPKERDDPQGGTKTAAITIDTHTACFIVKEEHLDVKQDAAVVLERVFTDVVANEIQIENQASFAVWGHILLDGRDVHPPQIITPGRTLMEDVRSPLHAAVTDEYASPGDIFKPEALLSESKEILTGDTVTISGSKWDGYSLSTG